MDKLCLQFIFVASFVAYHFKKPPFFWRWYKVKTNWEQLKYNFKEIFLFVLSLYIVIQRNSLSVDDNIYAPSWGLSTLVKEFTAATRTMRSSSNKLSTLVSGKV